MINNFIDSFLNKRLLTPYLYLTLDQIIMQAVDHVYSLEDKYYNQS